MINYYETLGVDASAKPDEIKNAYRTLVKRFHPDVPGGDPVRFHRVTEAYEVLSEPARRKAFDDALRTREARVRARNLGTTVNAGPAPELDPAAAFRGDGLGPPFTRIMSVVMPAGGRFLLEGLNGEFTILPTSEQDLWETTLQKFAGEDPAALAQRVVQIRLHGPREVVRQLRPMPAGFGIQLQGLGKEQFLGGMLEGEPSAGTFLRPGGAAMEELLGSTVQVTATVPVGVAVYLYDLSGKIQVGDLQGELVATLDERTSLRAGAIGSANITLNGRSKAHLRRITGVLDTMMFGQSKMLVEGQVTRLRAVLEHEAHLETTAEVGWLQATVGGRAYLNAKGPIDRAHCEVRAGGYARLAKVRQEVQGTRSGAAGFDVIQGPPRPQGLGAGAARPAPRKAFRGGLL